MIVLGLLVMTIGVIGLFRMPDVYLQLHAASKAVVLGVVVIAFATMATGDGAIVAKALLISAALVLTTPVASHAIARAAFRQEGERNAPRMGAAPHGRAARRTRSVP